MLRGTAAGSVGLIAAGIDPGAPFAAVVGITRIGVTGLEGLDVEDAALELGENSGIKAGVDFLLEGLASGESDLREGRGGGTGELAVELVELTFGLLGKDQRGRGIEG